MKSNVVVFIGLMIVLGGFAIWNAGTAGAPASQVEATTSDPTDSPSDEPEETSEGDRTIAPPPTYTPTPTAESTDEPSKQPTITRTASPDAADPFDGQWTAAFTLEENTRTGEARHHWLAFVIDLTQDGDEVTGTLQGIDYEVAGVLTGSIDAQGVLQGVIRLSWDDHDWQSITLILAPDGQSGGGSAVFVEAPDSTHYYSINFVAGITSAPPYPYIAPTATPELVPAAYNGQWIASFFCDLNTYTGETDQQWYSFALDLAQNGNQVSGTMQGIDIDVTGILNGTVDAQGVFYGNMRLSWDDHDWENLSLMLFSDGTGYGSATFKRSEEEYHYYSLYVWHTGE